jgi:hypothetical protein
MLYLNAHGQAVIIKSFQPKLTSIIHPNGLDAAIRETCFKPDYLGNKFGEGMVSSGQ